MKALTTASFFIVGLCVGSFLNVCIYRLPRKISLIKPGSFCPACRRPLKWWMNVPLLSYFLLRGKCSYCGKRISPRYGVVESLTGLIFAVAFLIVGFQPALLTWLFFSSVLIIVSFIDLEHQLIPNRIILPSLVIGAGLVVLTGVLKWQDSLKGALVGGAIIYGLALVWSGGMGGGDGKLAAFIGLFVGLKVLLSLFLAFLLGAAVGLTLIVFKLKTRKDLIPFGPFLSLGGILTFLVGDVTIRLYFSLF